MNLVLIYLNSSFGVDRALKAINTEEEHGMNKTIELIMELKSSTTTISLKVYFFINERNYKYII